MSLYRNPAPAYRARIRDKQRAESQPVPGLAEARHLAKTADQETLATFDLRPVDEILGEITARYSSTGITAEAAAALEAYPISEDALQQDADQKRARLVLLKARSDRREAPARARRAKAKAEARAKRDRVQAKAAKEKLVAKRWLDRQKASFARNPGLFRKVWQGTDFENGPLG